MNQEPNNNPISEATKKEIFLALVNAQDQNLSVAKSRSMVSEQFDISESDVRSIEREGLDNQWPPLAEVES